MSQCVPRWELDEHPTTYKVPFHLNSNTSDAKAPNVVDPILDYEVSELTWKNGQLALHGLGPPRVIGKPISSKYTWEKPHTSGTLESIVNQAAQLAPCETPIHDAEIVPWYNHQPTIGAGTIAMDAMVPSSNSRHLMTQDVGTCVTGKSTGVDSCGGTASLQRGKEVEGAIVRKRARVQPRVVAAREGCSRNQSVSASASVSDTFGGENRHVRVDSCEIELDTGFTSTSDTNPNTVDDRDSVSRPQKQARTDQKSRNEKSTISTKRGRAAAIHNQSERKRRDKINQRMKTLQKLVPNSSKTDKASMLDEVIEYLKTLQAQVQMMSRMSMPHLMMPMTMQQQLQMAMMAQMGMGLGVMDMNSMGRPNMTGMPQVINPAAFMPMAPWDSTNDRLPSSNAVLPDPMASFLACQTQQQPMTMDAYSRMAILYQQLHQQQQVSNSKP